MDAQRVPPPVARVLGDDALQGRWIGSEGSWLTFQKQGDHYSVTASGLASQLVEGIATKEGNSVSFGIEVTILGKFDYKLTLTGDSLRGHVTLLGLPPVPVTFNRG